MGRKLLGPYLILLLVFYFGDPGTRFDLMLIRALMIFFTIILTISFYFDFRQRKKK